MRAILFSDIHLGLSKDSASFHKTTIDVAEWIKEEAEARGIDTLICGGDVFHNRKAVTLSTLEAAYKFFKILEDFKIKIITGNHDCFYLDKSDINSICLLKSWENIEIYDEPHYENMGGKRVGFIPWGTEVKDMKKCDVMFGHYEITGFQMGPAMFCKHGMNATELLKKSPMVFSGHFHKPQVNDYKKGKIVYMGSPFQHNWGEANQDKYIYEFDFGSEDLEFIQNERSPEHITIKKDDDIDVLSTLTQNNIVKVITEDGSDLDVKMKAIYSKYDDKPPMTFLYEQDGIKKSAEAIDDFKTSDIVESFNEVIDTIEEIDDTLKDKIKAKCKDLYEKV